MSDNGKDPQGGASCDGDPQSAESGRGGKANVLLYACSGGANVGEVADRAARQLTDEGEGIMFCLAGLGAEIPSMVQTAKDAAVNVVIDGCSVACAKKLFDRLGIPNTVQIEVTDLGIEKVKGVRATDEQAARTMAAARSMIRG